MTDPSAKPYPTDRHRLRTFGTFALVGPQNDTLLGKHGHQQRRLALLAVLAAAGERGRSRDQLLLLFWPEVTQSRARHSLEQLLYEIRGTVGNAAFDGVNPVRLAPAVVSSDVAEFNDALERGDLETAVEAYRGPFLDGFHLTDAPEFEQWLDAERARLERSYAGALERLAQVAEAGGDHAAAARWWRKLSDADPVSSTNATGLIRALMNAGDHAAALQHAERYEAVVAEEVGTGVGPAVADLVAEVRASAKSPPVARVKSAPAAPAPRLSVAPVTVEPMRIEPVHPRRTSRRHTALYVVIALVVLIGATVLLRAVRRGRPSLPAAAPSIAVLPFANVSGDRQDAVLVDGLSEELIAVLARIPNLRVIARTSSFVFRNSDAGVRRIADSLGVSYLLEGSVQKIESQLRVQVRLVARDGSTRWSEIYDRKLGDDFAVQSEIATTVARELDLRLSEGTLARVKRLSTRNVAAHELYLRGNDPLLLRSDSGQKHALEYFRQALALDSNYAAAYTGLARLTMVVGAGGHLALSRREQLARAEQASRKAVALDDSLADAHAALSLVERGNYNFAAAEAEMKRAIALDTADARILGWQVQLDVATERPAEALVAARRALALDPLSPAVNAELARALLANGRCDEALAQLDKLRSLSQPLLRARSIAAQCYARRQMWPEAIAEMQRIPPAATRGNALLGYMLARGGRTSEARRILASLLDSSSKIHSDSFEIGTVYAGLGENEQAFAWLDKAVDERSVTFDYLALILDTLPHDARLDHFRQRLGLQKR